MTGPGRSVGRRFALRQHLSLPKDSKAGEDRWALHAAAGRIALCDGAGEGWDGAGWAEALSSSLARWGADEPALCRARTAYVRSAQNPAARAGPDWLHDAARARGSWATALVLELGAGGRSLRAAALGDTTLFVLEGFRLKLSFPMMSSEDFGAEPALLRAEGEAAGDPPFRRLWLPLATLRRPALVLATDALAAALLAEGICGAEELFRFLRAARPEAFAAWASAQIQAGCLGNDDLTLLWLG